jgi:hypothetical protein
VPGGAFALAQTAASTPSMRGPVEKGIAVDELHEHLREQVIFLRKSAQAVDKGDFLEAKRLVTPIRVLLHETSRSRGRALLSQLGVLGSMTFLDTAAELNPANLLTENLLTLMYMKAETRDGVTQHEAGYGAPLGDFPPMPARGQWRPFETWWRRPVIKDGHGSQFSRSDLVLAVAHKDGVMHVDELEEPYRRLSRSNSLGWFISQEGMTTPLGNPVLPSIRQIAFEVDQSLCRAFPELNPTP